MVEAIKNIGDIQYNDILKSGKDLLDVFTEDVSGNGVYKNCLEITVKLTEGDFIYEGIFLTQYDEDKIFKYLYRSGSSRGSDVTPTAKLTDTNKTFVNKILKSYQEAITYGTNKYPEEINQLGKIYSVLNDNCEKIIFDISEKLKTINKKEGVFLTVVLLDQEKKYVGDFQLFKDKLVNDSLKNFHYSETYGKEVSTTDAFCSICTDKSKDIFGLVNVFPFYTIDKPGYISSGFNYEKAWRNYPVCKDCAIKLELGKKYLDEHLLFYFYGRKYYLIPKPIYIKDLPTILRKYRTLNNKDVEEVSKDYDKTEERVFNFIKDEENSVAFDLMFIEKNNAALNILLNIEDVSPSRFKKIYHSLDFIRHLEFFKDMPVNFTLLNRVFPKDKYNHYFLDIIDKIISDNRIDYNFIIKFFNQYLQRTFINFEKGEFVKDEDTYSIATFRIFGFLYFLYFMQLFKYRKEEYNMSLNKNIWSINDYSSKNDLFNAFFDDATPFFDNNDKKAVFLIGLLTKKLLNIQYREENRKPFIVRLKSLKLNRKDMQRLFYETQAKLLEYKKDYYNDIYQIVSQYLIESNNLSQLSDNDIPFYFSLGFNMDKNFILSVKNDDEDRLEN